mmetsp:Transcript_35227/g.69938  ORF Transcript_35227/g.69938 Transcript_35227/m.69938 type:complete len:287 (+) Transcript_35227:67-927(+)
MLQRLPRVMKFRLGRCEVTKAIFRCEDGALTEAMLTQATSSTGLHNTVCVSSQIGCRRTCGHCSSGLAGFKRNLTTSEIVSQVAAFAVDHEIDKVVFHGIGEPLDNPAVCHAANFLVGSYDKLVCNCDGVEYGARAPAAPAVCLSTVGNSNAMLELASIAPSTRVMLSAMPDMGREEPLEELLETTDEFVRRTGNNVALSYTMIDGLDTQQYLDELLRHMQRRTETHVVQLVQYHIMTPPSGGMAKPEAATPSEPASIRRFVSQLRAHGCRVGFGQYCEFPSELAT